MTVRRADQRRTPLPPEFPGAARPDTEEAAPQGPCHGRRADGRSLAVPGDGSGGERGISPGLTRPAATGLPASIPAWESSAQRLYGQRGYIPDGRGACQGQRPLSEGMPVAMDDDLIMWLTEDLVS